MDNARCLQWQPIVTTSDARRSNHAPRIFAPLARSGVVSPSAVPMHSVAGRRGSGVVLSRGALGVGSGGFRRYDSRLLAGNSIARAGALLEVERRSCACGGAWTAAPCGGGGWQRRSRVEWRGCGGGATGLSTGGIMPLRIVTVCHRRTGCCFSGRRKRARAPNSRCH